MTSNDPHRRIPFGGLAKVFGIVLLSFPVIAAAAFFFRAEADFPVLEEEISYRADDAASSFEQVAADDDAWISQKERPFRATGEPIRIWAKFAIPAAAVARRVLLRAGPWESAEYFVIRDGRLVDHQKVGTLVPLGERATNVSMTPAAFHAGFVAVDLPPQAHVAILARLATDNRFVTVQRLRFSLWDADQVLKGELSDRLFQGGFFGVMLTLMLYNLALFCLNLREVSYLYYVIVLATSTMVQGMMFGLTQEFLWPSHPAWDFYCMWIGLPLSLWAFAQFVRHYLDTGRHFPRSDVSLKWAGYAALMSLPVYLVPFAVGRPVSLYVTLLGTVLLAAVAVPLILGVTVMALRKRHPLARLFLAAMCCSAAGAFITFGAWLDFLPEVELTLNASQIGTALTGILLSMGLGFRMRQLHKDLADKQIAEVRLRGEVALREKSEELLSNILPRAIIDELKAKGQSEPRRHDEASILFTDFSGFTQAVSTMPPKRLVQELDEIFRAFDDIIAGHGLEKIKTIGDAYMAASGLPVAAEDHAVRCVRAGLELARFIDARNRTAPMKWGLRVGVHSGAVVAGIVGKHKYVYDVWGDTVNVASRLEGASEVNRVNISAYTFELVQKSFDCEYRGKLAAKGKGEIDMYFVLRERSDTDTATRGQLQ